MLRISKRVENLENKIRAVYKKHKADLPKIIGLGVVALYFYGLFINSVKNGIANFKGASHPLIEWSPVKNIFAVFTPVGLGVTFVIILFYFLLNKKGQSLISGYKTVKDKERGLEILPDGTHGTSGWLTKKEMAGRFDIGPVSQRMSNPNKGCRLVLRPLFHLEG